ncbi:MAG: DUF374 domain-containing protein [Pseudomonadota bacterium]
MTLRKRIADSDRVNRFAEAVLAGWIKLAYRTSTWERFGFEEMERALKNKEPAIIVFWHQRVMMAPYFLDLSCGPVCTLTSASRAGRLAGHIVNRFGLRTIAMSSHTRHIALTRKVMRLMRQGVSFGMAADGPRGPARIAKIAPVTWAQATGHKLFVVSFSARRVHTLGTWDKMWFPALWTRGVFICREWKEVMGRFADAAETERLRHSLQSALDQVTDEADRKAGRRR